VVLIAFLLTGLAERTKPTKLPRSNTADEMQPSQQQNDVLFLFGTSQEQNGSL
jgi:hypothetical protein